MHRLLDAGIVASVGRRGDAYHNAIAEPTNGLYAVEVIHHLGLWKRLEDVEHATRDWTAWHNTQRLMAPLGDIPRWSTKRCTVDRAPPPWRPDSSSRGSVATGPIRLTH